MGVLENLQGNGKKIGDVFLMLNWKLFKKESKNWNYEFLSSFSLAFRTRD